LAKIDRRRREARLLETTRAELAVHLGGAPSAVQRLLIERAAMLTLHVALFDERAIAAQGMSERDAREYLAYSNSLTRTLKALGVDGAAQKAPTLQEYLRAKAENAEAAA
jgi:hypothetical protein